ncbi:hypothetical protein AAFF_G00011860 [Aldrovandia affinis]|uniref:Uncharacterized protein n=1 Tax=Aldrovandia affinis TaxID=143900 RepID=A0AAD7S6L7_9TELE|nr:hypothetical protein AAFF_G00011860 [Aldrovandia affinis]
MRTGRVDGRQAGPHACASPSAASHRPSVSPGAFTWLTCHPPRLFGLKHTTGTDWRSCVHVNVSDSREMETVLRGANTLLPEQTQRLGVLWNQAEMHLRQVIS